MNEFQEFFCIMMVCWAIGNFIAIMVILNNPAMFFDLNTGMTHSILYNILMSVSYFVGTSDV